jgi:hypothetical protein
MEGFLMGIGRNGQIRMGVGAAIVATAALLSSALVPPATGAGAVTSPKVPSVSADVAAAAKYAVPIPAVTKAGKVRTPKEMTLAAKKTTGPITFPATGYFATGQADGRWWLVTPTGQPFYADGVDHVSAGGDTDQVTGTCPYCQTIAADYPSTAAWDTATLARLRSWGFNNIGDYSDDTTLGTQMPFTVQLNMDLDTDVFADQFVTDTDADAAAEVPQWADNPNVIGYFTDDEPGWGPPGAGPYGENLQQQYLQLPAGSPGLAVAQEYAGNLNGFITAVTTRYFSVTTAAVRMYDTNHLILGVKAEGQEIQPQVIESAVPYVNVFSVEDYTLTAGFAQAVDQLWPYYLPVEPNLANMESYFNGPMMIGEYAFIAPGPQDPNTDPGIYYISANQQARANDYANFLAPLYEDAPWLVGDEWFQYTDQPANGRTPNGENNDFGLVNIEDQPYPEVTTAATLLHSILPDRLVQSGPTCDSWTNGPSGVVCNATMPASPTYPVSIIDEPLTAATQGSSYSDSVYAAGGTPASYKFSLSQGSLPKGLKLNKTGAISGTPKSPGTSSFTVKVVDGTESTTQAESIYVAPDVPLSVKTAKLAAAKLGVSYSKTLAATGGTAPYSWTVSAGSPPPGLSFGTGGQLTGLPTATGSYTFTAEATDSTPTPETATRAFTVTVKS